MLYKEIQDSGHGCNLGYKTESFLQLKPSIMPECIMPSFSISSEDSVWKEWALRGFQNSRHCGHLGYCNEAVIASQSENFGSVRESTSDECKAEYYV